MRLKRAENFVSSVQMTFSIDSPRDVKELIDQLGYANGSVTIDCTPCLSVGVTVEKDIRQFNSPSEAIAFLKERDASEVPGADYWFNVSKPETVKSLVHQLENVLTTNCMTIDFTPPVSIGITVEKDIRQFNSPSDAVVFLKGLPGSLKQPQNGGS